MAKNSAMISEVEPKYSPRACWILSDYTKLVSAHLFGSVIPRIRRALVKYLILLRMVIVDDF